MLPNRLHVRRFNEPAPCGPISYMIASLETQNQQVDVPCDR